VGRLQAEENTRLSMEVEEGERARIEVGKETARVQGASQGGRKHAYRS
jgi:hypothetical protein